MSIDLKKCRIVYSGDFEFERYFERFDFADEWNNLGYGRITLDTSDLGIVDLNWSSDQFDEVLARFELSDGQAGIFAGIKDGQVLVNRRKGVIDGIDQYLIDLHESKKRPILIDIPYGFKSAVTMRIDCDEAISTGKQLAELYQKHSVPFSMAITTKNEFDQDSVSLINQVLENKGSVVGHSHTHRPNWGGSREEACWEIEKSRSLLKNVLPRDYNFDFVVSPFHQNPNYAIEGIRDAGIRGFVSGIIKNDPDYLVSRASWAKDVEGIMTHSQQCMFHGDCYHKAGNSLSVYKKSFENHYYSNTFFGYLDHPFSNYKYGWLNEEERLIVHDEFLRFLKSYDGIWFANLVDSMSFLWVKVNTKVWEDNGVLRWATPKHDYRNLPDLCVMWKGEKHRIPISE